MTRRLDDVVGYLDEVLESEQFRDYAPNGLQVQGTQEVDRVVTGVSANLALFEKAIAARADLIVVHHGLIWGGGIARVVGPTAARLRALLENGISLAAYHLPLDAHPRVGNNVGLCDALGLGPQRGAFGDIRGHALGAWGDFPEPLARAEALDRVTPAIGGAPPAFVLPFGPDRVRRVGLCTGAAADLLEAASGAGCDLFITGELAERTAALAQELQITVVGAGHHRTERFGPQRLVGELTREFPDLEVQFIDVPNPL